MHSLFLTENIKKYYLVLHYNRANTGLFVNGTESYELKTKDSEIEATPLFIRNISKDLSVDNMNKTGLNGYVYDLLEMMMILQLMIYLTFISI